MKTVLVTGGSGGIGRAICLEFGRHGWQVGVHYHVREYEAKKTLDLVKNEGGKGLLAQADLTVKKETVNMFRAFLDVVHTVDVLICNAGTASSQLVVRTDLDTWNRVLTTNLTGTFHCLQAIGSTFLKQKRGAVVVVGSLAGFQGQRGQAAYAASKAGLVGLIRSIAQEWGPFDISVNGVLPGWHHTEMTEAVPRTVFTGFKQVLPQTPAREEVARSVFHFATLQGTSGQVWNLDSRIV